jgi:hypothetical protein
MPLYDFQLVQIFINLTLLYLQCRDIVKFFSSHGASPGLVLPDQLVAAPSLLQAQVVKAKNYTTENTIKDE